MSESRRRSGPVYATGDRRTGDAPHHHESVYDFFVDLIQGGFAQVTIFTLPVLFVLAATPVYAIEVGTAAVVSVLTLTFFLPLFRGGHLAVGRRWPVLTNRKLGTGTGYRALFTRAVVLSCSLLLAAYTAVLAELVTGSFVANALTALVLSVAALVALPYLSAGSRRARLARFAYCLSSFLPMVALFALTPAALEPGLVVLVLVVLCSVIVDARSVLLPR
ncbi:hypothetical protein [Natronorarus salvus]|uniref:hypothetical protein n=1 Tax=Natronorarus salvus TaxID=3117733 RepID=UPI002F26B1AB